MSQPTREQVTELTTCERLDHISEWWSSLSHLEASVAASQTAELERRLATFENDRAHSVSWENLKAEFASCRA